MAFDDFESAARFLEQSNDFKVLRRLQPRPKITGIPEADIRRGLYVDVESTGLDTAKDEIIELAMVPFLFSTAGVIVEVLEPFCKFREPSIPISDEITAITGITNEMVAGCVITQEEVIEFAKDVDLVVAHNAGYDRKMLERFCLAFVDLCFACSMSEVPWKEQGGFEGTKLSYLASQCGFFYDKHRAVNDCHAAIELLTTTLVKSNRTALDHLLENARKPSWRVWAEAAPFDLKDVLKKRKYSWNDGTDGFPRSWRIDIEDHLKEAELAFLKAEIYQQDVDIRTIRITAYERFSARV